MILYRYHSTPILVNNTLLRFKGAEFLATTAEGEEVRELTGEDVASCLKLDRNFHCSHQNVINRNSHNLCLASLFFNKDPTQTCEVTVAKATAYAHQIGEGTFIYSSTKSFYLTKFCTGKSTSYDFYEKGTHRIEIDTGCTKYTTEDFVLVHNPELAVKEDLKKKFIDFNQSMLEEGVPKGWSVNDAVLKHFHSSPALQPLDLNSLKEELTYDEARYKALHMGMTGIAAIMIIAAGVMALILYTIWTKYCRKNNCKKKGNDCQEEEEEERRSEKWEPVRREPEMQEEVEQIEVVPVRITRSKESLTHSRRLSTPKPAVEIAGVVNVDPGGRAVTFQSTAAALPRHRNCSGEIMGRTPPRTVEEERLLIRRTPKSVDATFLAALQASNP